MALTSPPMSAPLDTRQLLRSAVAHPTWVAAHARQLMAARRPDPVLDAAASEPYLMSAQEAVAAVLDVRVAHVAAHWPSEVSDAESDAAFQLRALDARPVLREVVAAIVRLMRPAVMVETGVAAGHTSAVALGVMEEIGEGRLVSVDLPPLRVDHADYTGHVVGPELRGRWTLVLGSSRQQLPRVLRKWGPIDVFLHDSDHAYAAQLREYRTAWPHLRAGGVLISDDVASPAFLEFASEVGARPHLIAGTAMSGTTSALGLLRKAQP